MHNRPGRLKTDSTRSHVIKSSAARTYSPSATPMPLPAPPSWTFHPVRRAHLVQRLAPPAALVPTAACSKLLLAALSSVASAVSVSAILHPLDVVKILQIKEGNRVFDDSSTKKTLLASSRAIRTLVHRRGLRAAWTGVGVSSVATAVSWGAFRIMYDSIRQHALLSPLASSSRNAIAGSVASAMTILLTHPLFNAKSALALQAMKEQRPLTNPLADMYKSGGIQALYRGVDSVLLAIPHNTIQMVAYEKLKTILPLYAPQAKYPLGRLFQTFPSQLQSTLKQAAWAFLSKAVASSLTYPLNVVRIFQQHPPESLSDRDTLSVARYIYRTEGVGAFYRGFGTHMQRVLLHNTLVFIVFERLQAKRQEVHCSRGSESIRLTMAPPLDVVELMRAQKAPAKDQLVNTLPDRKWRRFRPVFRRVDGLISHATVHRRTTSLEGKRRLF